MIKLDQSVSVQLGQAGLQIATCFWEILCIEHGIGPDGVPIFYESTTSEYNSATSLYDIGRLGHYIPRALFIDSEPTVMDGIRSGIYKELFKYDMLVNDSEDAGNNFARGSYTIGRKMINKIQDCIRRLAEHTDNLSHFLILNSTGGGTGSGLSPLVLLSLSHDYPKVTRCCSSLVPGNTYTTAIVEPYNMLLNSFAALETANINFLFDNDAVYRICEKKLFINSPNYTDVNRIVSMMLNSITCTFCNPSTLRSSLTDTLTNLIPYPRIHFPITRYAPIKHISKATYEKITTTEVTKELFSQSNQSLNVDTNKGLFISILLNYQGMVNTSEIYKSIDQQKTLNPNKFVEWSPTGFKVGICTKVPSLCPMLEMSPLEQSAIMLINNTVLSEFFRNQTRKFDLLYNKRCFMHWYIGEGMEESEFYDTRTEVELIIQDYREIEMTEKIICDKGFQSKGHGASVGTIGSQEIVTSK